MFVIPLKATPAQEIEVLLANQPTKLVVSQKRTGMFIDIYLNDELIIGGVICENLNRIVRDAYFGFIGDLGFVDLEGNTDPVYTGLGTRYVLAYIEASELPG